MALICKISAYLTQAFKSTQAFKTLLRVGGGLREICGSCIALGEALGCGKAQGMFALLSGLKMDWQGETLFLIDSLGLTRVFLPESQTSCRPCEASWICDGVLGPAD